MQIDEELLTLLVAPDASTKFLCGQDTHVVFDPFVTELRLRVIGLRFA